MGAMYVSAWQVHPSPFRHSHWWLALWGSKLKEWDWWLRIDSLLGIRLGDSSMQIAINKSMRIFELEKTKTPEQLRLDQLRATSKRASDALKIERDRQKAQRAQKTLRTLRTPNKPVTPYWFIKAASNQSSILSKYLSPIMLRVMSFFTPLLLINA